MEQNFNQLTPAQTERLSLLAEDCGEIIEVVGKILRHGYDSYHPKDKDKTTNRELLERELGDLSLVMTLLTLGDDIDYENVDDYAEDKAERIDKYLHHNNFKKLYEDKLAEVKKEREDRIKNEVDNFILGID